MSDRILEQRININFCVNFEKNESDICAVFSEAYGGEAMIKCFEFCERFKESSHVEVT
jgi:hypothetical protein